MQQVREAIAKSTWKPQNTILFQRDELEQSLDEALCELDWNQLARLMRTRRRNAVPGDGGLKREKVPSEKDRYVEVGEAFPSEDPQYIIYTSGRSVPSSPVRPITDQFACK